MRDIVVELAVIADARDILNIILSSRDEGLNVYSGNDKHPSNIDELAEIKSAISYQGTDRIIHVAKTWKKILGFCRLSKWTVNRLLSIYVLPEYHGQWIASLLWKKSINFFDNDENIFVEVLVSKIKAVAFYEKIGFMKISTDCADKVVMELRRKKGFL